MKKEVLLLEYIIGLWDDVEQAFQIGPQMLKIELDDVYFLTGLSRRGAPIIFSDNGKLLSLSRCMWKIIVFLGHDWSEDES
jgi:hypothetical protein